MKLAKILSLNTALSLSVAFLWMGCGESAIVTEHLDQEQAVIDMDESYVEPLITNLNEYFKAGTEERFEDYVELAYPKVFSHDSLKQMSIDQMRQFSEMGVHNLTESFKIVYLSPLVEDTNNYVSLVMMRVQHTVQFTEAYQGDPAELTPMIRSQYGNDAFKYNPQQREYYINTVSRMYAITPKDRIHFTFLNDTYLHSRHLAGLLPYDVVSKLKEYEEVQNKRLKALGS